jgi:hypothetical protein
MAMGRQRGTDSAGDRVSGRRQWSSVLLLPRA